MSTLAAPVPSLPWWKETQWVGWTLDAFDFTIFLLIMHPGAGRKRGRAKELRLDDAVLVGACFGGWVAAEWITGGLAHMREHGLERIEATPDAVDRWVQHVNDAANAALLPQARHSWYLGANVPGKPRVCSCLMPAGWRAIARSAPANRNGYEGFALSV